MTRSAASSPAPGRSPRPGPPRARAAPAPAAAPLDPQRRAARQEQRRQTEDDDQAGDDEARPADQARPGRAAATHRRSPAGSRRGRAACSWPRCRPRTPPPAASRACPRTGHAERDVRGRAAEPDAADAPTRALSSPARPAAGRRPGRPRRCPFPPSGAAIIHRRPVICPIAVAPAQLAGQPWLFPVRTICVYRREICCPSLARARRPGPH